MRRFPLVLILCLLVPAPVRAEEAPEPAPTAEEPPEAPPEEPQPPETPEEVAGEAPEATESPPEDDQPPAEEAAEAGEAEGDAPAEERAPPEEGEGDGEAEGDEEEDGDAPEEERAPPEEGEDREEEDGDDGESATYILEEIEIRGNRRTRDRVIMREIAFEPGGVLDLDDERIELSRYRLLATGFFSDVRLRLRRGSRRGAVVLVVEVVERWTLVVREVFLGVTEITPYGGLYLDEINFLGYGISLSGAFVVSEQQQGYRVRFAVPRFLDSPVSLSLEFLYNDARDFLGRRPVLVSGREGEQSYAQTDYTRLGGVLGLGLRLAHNTNIYLDYRLELIRANLPAAAAQLDLPFGSEIGEPLDFHLLLGRSILSAFVISLDHDTRDHPFLPSRGRHITGSAVVSTDVIGSNYHFVKLTLGADFYFRLPWRHSLHVGLLIGLIFGDAPLFEHYFIGDLSDQVTSRVLGLNFSHAPAPNIFRTSIEEMRYEKLAGRLDLEYIVPLYRGRRIVYGLDFFLLLGLYSLGSSEDFVNAPVGYSGGAFPIDMTLDVGFRLDTTVGVFGFSFQNLLGLIPFSEE